MNDLTDLRDVLERHAADAVRHEDGASRSRAVHERVRLVRRRRRVAAAGALVAAVLVAGGVSLLPGGGTGREPGPAALGVDVPSELVSLGFGYDYVDHRTGDGRLTWDLPATGTPRLVSWATTADRMSVTVGGGDEPHVVDGSDFADWSYVAPGDGLRITARADGRVALAVYELGDRRPDGVTAGGVTYRDSRAGLPLLGASVGEPGAAEVAVPVSEPATERGAVFFSFFCSGGPTNAWLHVATDDGELLFGRGCDDDVPTDPAALGGSSSPVRPGDDLSARMYVTQGEDGPLVQDDDLRIGLGLYAEGLLDELPAEVEHDGHTWRLDRTDEPEVRGRTVDAAVPPLTDRQLLLVQVDGVGAAVVTVEVDGRGNQVYGGGGATHTVDVPLGAKVASLVRRTGTFDKGRVVFGFYVRAD